MLLMCACVLYFCWYVCMCAPRLQQVISESYQWKLHLESVAEAESLIQYCFAAVFFPVGELVLVAKLTVAGNSYLKSVMQVCVREPRRAIADSGTVSVNVSVLVFFNQLGMFTRFTSWSRRNLELVLKSTPVLYVNAWVQCGQAWQLQVYLLGFKAVLLKSSYNAFLNNILMSYSLSLIQSKSPLFLFNGVNIQNKKLLQWRISSTAQHKKI